MQINEQKYFLNNVWNIENLYYLCISFGRKLVLWLASRVILTKFAVGVDENIEQGASLQEVL